ncbi:MAG: M23 family metallopeptidase [Nitrospirae bacterium]|nr:M23 family metallopeptidase [Nitrospirota bacterium]
MKRPKSEGGGTVAPKESLTSRVRSRLARLRHQSYTLMLVPSGRSGKIMQFRASSLTLRLVFGACALGIVAVVSLSLDAIRLRRQFGNLRALQEQNAAQGVALDAVSEKAAFLDQELLKIKRFDHRLRKVMNLDLPREEATIVGAGGAPDPDASYYSQLSREDQEEVRETLMDFDEIARQVNVEYKSLHDLETYMSEQQSILDALPTIRPATGWRTSRYGNRRSPFTGLRQMHRGVDISNAVGTPIVSPADGVVLFAGRKGEFGKFLVIDHGYGHVTRFGHLSKLNVEAGQRVKRRQVVAALGNTGISTGPHLHYEVWVNGQAQDPEAFFLDQE